MICYYGAIALYVGSVLVTVACNSTEIQEVVDDVSMVKIDKKDSFENDEHKPTIFELVELGNNITQTIKTLNPPGHKFVRDLYVYWEDISWARTFYRLNRTDGRLVYNAIKKQGGPPFLKVDFDDNQMLKAFNWPKKYINEVRQTIHDVDVIWSHMDSELENEDEYLAPTFYSKRKD